MDVVVCELKKDGEVFQTIHSENIWKVLARLGHGEFRMVSMTKEEYHAIPVTNASERLFS